SWAHLAAANHPGSSLKVGTGLRSCTAPVTPTAPFFIGGRQVVLLDTPGFDDTNKSDIDVLEEIAGYMSQTYNLCGEEALTSVVVVTNLWGLLPNQELGEARELELKTSPEFFEPLIQQGARFVRHTDTVESAHNIVLSLLSERQGKERLTIQTEMVDDRLILEET
ncbi:12967_t:CDS:2, partial [Acaulospora colombiana]